MPRDVPHRAGHDDGADDDVELVEVDAQVLPVLPHAHADPRQHRAPYERADERVHDERGHPHLRHARGEGDEGAYHGQEPRHEDRYLAVAREPAVGQVQVVVRDQHVPPVFFDERPPAPRADVIGHERAEDAADGTHQRHEPEVEDALRDQVAREGQDDLGRQGDAGALDAHQEDDARVTHVLDGVDDEQRQEDKYLLYHVVPLILRSEDDAVPGERLEIVDLLPCLHAVLP